MPAIVIFIIIVATTSLDAQHGSRDNLYVDGNKPGLKASLSWKPWASLGTRAFAYTKHGEVSRLKLPNRTVETVYLGQC